MFGWMLIFAIMLLVATLVSIPIGFGTGLAVATSVVFGALFVLSALTLVLRRRA
jgi:hypothetical protein